VHRIDLKKPAASTYRFYEIHWFPPRDENHALAVRVRVRTRTRTRAGGDAVVTQSPAHVFMTCLPAGRSAIGPLPPFRFADRFRTATILAPRVRFAMLSAGSQSALQGVLNFD